MPKWHRYLAATLIMYWLTILSACSEVDEPVSETVVANHGLLSAALSPDGNLLFTGSFQHGGALWDQTSQERLFNWNHENQSLPAQESLTGELTLRTVRTAELLDYSSPRYSAYNNADFSEDGKYLAATDGKALTIWDAQSGDIALFLQSPAQSVAIKNTESIWQTADNAAHEYWNKPARINDLAFSKQYILLGLENQIALLVDSSIGATVGALVHKDVITGVAMDDSATLALTGSRDGSATLWSLESGESQFEVPHSKPITFVDISPNGQYLIVAAESGPVTAIHTQTQAHTILFTGNPGIISAAFLANSEVIVGTSREEIWRLDLVSGEKLQRWQVPKLGPWHKTAVIALGVSLKRKMINSGGSERQESQKMIHAIGSSGSAYQIALSN